MSPQVSEKRRQFSDLINDLRNFSSYLYRPNDSKFWIANKNENVSISGIEFKNVRDFVAALSKNAKRKNIQQENLH